jgi:hypothetical protein
VKIRFVIGQTSVTATLDDSGSTRGFASLLPLELERFYRQDGRSLSQPGMIRLGSTTPAWTHSRARHRFGR